MGAARIDRPDGGDVRVHLAEFLTINRARRASRHFHQTHVRSQIDHPRIDGQSARVDLLRAGGNGSTSADSRDAPAANDNRAVFDVGAADGDDMRVPYYIGGRGRVRHLRVCAISVLRTRRRGERKRHEDNEEEERGSFPFDGLHRWLSSLYSMSSSCA